MMIMNCEPAYWDRLHESKKCIKVNLVVFLLLPFLCHSIALIKNSLSLLSLQKIPAMSIIFDAAMDDVFLSVGNVIKRKIVVMEVMKTPAFVVSSAHLHLIITAFLSLFYVIYRYVKLNECLIVSDSEECSF
jgi:hypothetical protein